MVLEAEKYKAKVPAGSVLGEGQLILGSQMMTASLGPHTVLVAS